MNKVASESPEIEAKHRRYRLIGIGLMCLAVVCFACSDSTAKYLNRHVDVVLVIWGRYAGGFLLTLLVSNPWATPGMMRSKRPWLQVTRGMLLFGSTMFNYVALIYLQLDQAVSILFATPFLVAILSGPVLGEWVGWRRWIAIVVGFGGVLLVIRPGLGGIHPAAILSVGCTICYAVYSVITRILSRFDSTQTTLFYSNLVGAAIVTPALPFVWSTPSWWYAGMMLFVGCFATLGHFFLIAAHRLAPASVLSPYIYTQLLWTTILGFGFFGDVPDRWTLAGAAVVIGSGLYLFYRERKRGQPPSVPLGETP